MINMCWEKYNPVAPIAKKKENTSCLFGTIWCPSSYFSLQLLHFTIPSNLSNVLFSSIYPKKREKRPLSWTGQRKKHKICTEPQSNGWPFKQSDLASLEGRYKGFVPIYLSVDTYRTFVHFKHLFSGFVRGNTRLEVNINLWNGNKRFGYEWIWMN